MVQEQVDAGERVVTLNDLSAGFVGPRVPLVVGHCHGDAWVTRIIHEFGVRTVMHHAGCARALHGLRHLRTGQSLVLNCGYGRGIRSLKFINAVKQVVWREFPVDLVA
jgi:UDP-glucose 4-epimerase